MRDLHARNVAVLLGTDLRQPAHAVVCWTRDGQDYGGTGMAIRLALHHRIPVLNLAETDPREALRRLEGIAASVGASLSRRNGGEEREVVDRPAERRRDGSGEDRSQGTAARSPSPREARSVGKRMSVRL